MCVFELIFLLIVNFQSFRVQTQYANHTVENIYLSFVCFGKTVTADICKAKKRSCIDLFRCSLVVTFRCIRSEGKFVNFSLENRCLYACNFFSTTRIKILLPYVVKNIFFGSENVTFCDE